MTIETLNPRDNSVYREVETDTITDVDAAYRRATEAQQTWADRPLRERASFINDLLHEIDLHKETIYDALVMEAASSQSKAEAEIDSATGIIEQARGYPGRVSGDIEESNTTGKTNYVHRDPKGVITAITAWNFPFHLASRIVAPAIALGNTVVLKPSPETPYVGGRLFKQLCDYAGIPDGVINVVVGSDDAIGPHVASHEQSDMLAFTGSTEVGKKVGKQAVEQLNFPALELGGNSPQIVLDDADIDRAAEEGAFGSFFHAGQVCTAINRHIVHEDIAGEYADNLCEYAEDWERKPVLINQSQADRLERLVNNTVKRSVHDDIGPAMIHCGGDRDGRHYSPTVITNVRNDHPIAVHEHFGPVAPIIEVSSEQEAIAVANDIDRGLSSSVWSQDEKRATQVGRQIQAGMVHINDHTIGNEAHVPFGGQKASGIGRYNDEPLIKELTETQCLAVQR